MAHNGSLVTITIVSPLVISISNKFGWSPSNSRASVDWKCEQIDDGRLPVCTYIRWFTATRVLMPSRRVSWRRANFTFVCSISRTIIPALFSCSWLSLHLPPRIWERTSSTVVSVSCCSSMKAWVLLRKRRNCRAVWQKGDGEIKALFGVHVWILNFVGHLHADIYDDEMRYDIVVNTQRLVGQ